MGLLNNSELYIVIYNEHKFLNKYYYLLHFYCQVHWKTMSMSLLC